MNLFAKGNKRTFKTRRGISVSETIVAMAIIVIVTAAGLSAYMASLKIQNNALNSEKVYNVCNEFVCAFYGSAESGSDFDAEFLNRITFAAGCTAVNASGFDGEEGGVIIYESSGGTSSFTYSAPEFTVAATVVFSDGKPLSIAVTGRASGIDKTVYDKTFFSNSNGGGDERT